MLIFLIVVSNSSLLANGDNHDSLRRVEFTYLLFKRELRSFHGSSCRVTMNFDQFSSRSSVKETEGAFEGGARTMAVHSTLNLGELLCYDDMDDMGHDSSPKHCTLASMLNLDSDNLMDVLNDDDDERLRHNPKFPWRSFGNRLRFRRAASALWRPADNVPLDTHRKASRESCPLPASEAVVAGRTTASMKLDAESATKREATTSAVAPPSGPTQETPPLRVSLMTLLEESDRPTMAEGVTPMASTSASATGEWEASINAGGVGGKVEESGKEGACCVCKARHGGTAFIPCGHVVCRTCTREPGVHRGSCPLCNSFILEIVGIF